AGRGAEQSVPGVVDAVGGVSARGSGGVDRRAAGRADAAVAGDAAAGEGGRLPGVVAGHAGRFGVVAVANALREEPGGDGYGGAGGGWAGADGGATTDECGDQQTVAGVVAGPGCRIPCLRDALF